MGSSQGQYPRAVVKGGSQGQYSRAVVKSSRQGQYAKAVVKGSSQGVVVNDSTRVVVAGVAVIYSHLKAICGQNTFKVSRIKGLAFHFCQTFRGCGVYLETNNLGLASRVLGFRTWGILRASKSSCRAASKGTSGPPRWLNQRA